MTAHELKVQPPYFDALLDGSKTFEVRRNDRGYQRGDLLSLREWVTPSPIGVSSVGLSGYTGRHLWANVTYVYSGDFRFGGIEPGHVVLGIKIAQQREDQP